jgi:hypothetical protein
MPTKKEAVDAEEQLAKMEEELAASAKQEDPEQSEEQTSDEESPPSEEKAAEEELEEAGANDADDNLTEDEISLLSERAQKRYREMAGRIKELETKKQEPPKEDPVVELEDEFPIGDVEIDDDIVSPARMPWDRSTDTPSIDLATYKRQVAQAAKGVVEQVLSAREERKRQQTIFTAFKDDLEKVRKDYPELDDIKAGPEYDEDLASKVATYYKPIFEEYKAKGKYYRFDAFVKDWMSLKERGRSEGADEVRSAVDKQDGEQAFRPSGETIDDKSDISKKLKSVKTIEELEALEADLS